jgi:DNA-binding NtrC family response regulator
VAYDFPSPVSPCVDLDSAASSSHRPAIPPAAAAHAFLSGEMLGFSGLVADCGHPVLLHGETGSGKTHLAKEIHLQSQRAGKAFVRVNCAAIPDTLFEREMFGHVRGAFTDAREAGTGFFEAADGGTLFLDEIGEIPLAVQPKLLAALEEGCFRRLGSPREMHVDVQIIAATNRDLLEMVQAKQFREDLFYRFSVLRYRVPPLRERPGELAALIRHLLRKIARGGTEPATVTEPALELLRAYPWPGNIRELDNVLSATQVFARGEPIGPRHLPTEVRGWRPPAPGRSSKTASDRYLAPCERERELHMIREALQEAHGNKAEAARQLGMSRSTLWAKLKEYGLTINRTAAVSAGRV